MATTSANNTSDSTTCYADYDISSASVTATLKVDCLYPSGFTLERFSADSNYTADAVDLAEYEMGVDGHIAGGWVPTIHTVTIHLQANSPSFDYLNNLRQAMAVNKKIYNCTLTLRIESIRKLVVFSNGGLSNAKYVPDGEKILGPTEWTLSFEKVEISSL